MSDPQIRQALTPPEQKRPIVGRGAGGIVNDARPPAYRQAGFEVIGIVDLDRSGAEAAAERFGVATDVVTSAASYPAYRMSLLGSDAIERRDSGRNP